MFTLNHTYMLKLGIGDPVKSRWFPLDTAAGLTWTQCQPCKSCYEQNDPIYNSRSFKSNKKLPCYDASCKSPFHCFEGDCFYGITYGDVYETKEVDSLDTSTLLPPDEPSPVSVQNIRFGCSLESKDFVSIQKKIIAGIMGLNWDSTSFMVQLGRLVPDRFSCCLFQPDKSFHSLLEFGDQMYDKK